MPTERALRLIHVVDSLEYGGLERVVTDLAIEQHSRGHRVCVFSIQATSGFADELHQAGVAVVTGDKSAPFDLKVLSRLRQAARDADVVHAHNFSPNYYAACALFGLWRAPVLVGTCHDMGSRLSNPKLRWIYRRSLQRTARVAMVGQQVFERYVHSGLVSRERATTVLNGIPVARFQAAQAQQRAARERLGLDEHDLVLGCVGRLVELKNHRLLLDTAPALIRRHPRLRIVIVGYGEQEAALREQIATLGIGAHVMLTGKRSDVAELLPAFDVFALPSKTEGLSIALLEACASGLAVVASQVGGNPEIIAHGRTGLLVPVDDGPALSEALDALLSDPTRRQQLGLAASRWVAAHASTAALALAYDEFYRRALIERGRLSAPQAQP